MDRRFPRNDVRTVVGVTIGAAVFVGGLIGAALGWVANQLFEHLHDESRSEHFRR